MATNIQFSNLTNATTPTDGTGYLDKLLKTINLHVDDQYKKGRLKGPDYASVYLGSIQSAISQSLEFLLKEKLIGAQIDGATSDNILKAAQLVKLRNEEEATLEKQWGYDVTRDPVDGSLILGNSTGNGIIDKQGTELAKNIDVAERTTVLKEAESTKQQALLDKELDIKTYDNATLQVDNHNTNLKQIDSITKDIDVKERQMVEAEATGSKQRLSIDKDNLLKDDELLINIKKKAQLDADIAEILDSTTRADTQLTDQLLSTAKDRDVKERNTVVQESELADKLLTTLEQRKLLIEQEKEAYTNRIIKDKEAVKAGLDKLNKTVSDLPEDVYTPKYKTI